MDAINNRYIAELLVSFYTTSLTLFADGLDSMADALISFIVWFGIYMIQKPKNRLFQYGYAKVESFAAFVAAVVVIILGLFIIYNAYERILHPVETTYPEITLITYWQQESYHYIEHFVYTILLKSII
ncbi:MAG TPA: cation transporter [Nitrososphaeraceae archaeon]|nr:cation transporter [Nitrososphaeraceae archaeon]